MSKSSLSAVVSNLVRASMGTSVSATVPDEDLDKHVAELILKEAKQKAESYAKFGVQAYFPTTYVYPTTILSLLYSVEHHTLDLTRTLLAQTNAFSLPLYGARMTITRLSSVHRLLLHKK